MWNLKKTNEQTNPNRETYGYREQMGGWQRGGICEVREVGEKD